MRRSLPQHTFGKHQHPGHITAHAVQVPQQSVDRFWCLMRCTVHNRLRICRIPPLQPTGCIRDALALQECDQAAQTLHGLEYGCLLGDFTLPQQKGQFGIVIRPVLLQQCHQPCKAAQAQLRHGTPCKCLPCSGALADWLNRLQRRIGQFQHHGRLRLHAWPCCMYIAPSFGTAIEAARPLPTEFMRNRR